LFTIYSKLGSFSAKDRADAISAQNKTLSDHYNFKAIPVPPKLKQQSLVYGERHMSISENDVLWEQLTKVELSKIKTYL
jgi:hypothetical protein